MGDLAAAAFSYPTAIYTALLGAVVFYWLLALIGLIDFDDGHAGLDFDLDGDVGDIGTVAAYLIAFGLGGVPLSVVVSLLVLIGWTLCCLFAMWLLPLVPTTVLQSVAGTAGLLGSFALTLPLTAAVVRPLRKLFVTHGAISNAALVGQPCRILTRSVDEKFGRAEVSGRGPSYNIRVYADTPNSLTRGSTAIITDYDSSGARYHVRAEE